MTPALLNPEELANKANEILDKITDSDRPENVRVDLVAKFTNGHALLYFNSKEAVKWFCQLEIEEAFFQKFDKKVFVKERLHNFLLQGVPIIFDPSKEAYLHEIEEVNSLAKYSFLKLDGSNPKEEDVKAKHMHMRQWSSLVQTRQTASSRMEWRYVG
jgi:hypothetical protein